MIALLLIWLLWTTLAIAFGVVVGVSIREADRREQPEAQTDRVEVRA